MTRAKKRLTIIGEQRLSEKAPFLADDLRSVPSVSIIGDHAAERRELDTAPAVPGVVPRILAADFCSYRSEKELSAAMEKLEFRSFPLPHEGPSPEVIDIPESEWWKICVL